MPPTPEELAAAAAAEAEAAAAAEAAEAAAAEAALGDAGKRAIEAERAAAKQARREKAAADKAREAAEARVAELEAATQTDQEKELAEARKEAADAAKAEALAEYSVRILDTEILAAATGRLVRPADALALIDRSTFDVDSPVDELRATLKTAMDALIAERPYLRAGQVDGDGDGGAKPSPPTDDDKLTPSQRLQRGYANSKPK